MGFELEQKDGSLITPVALAHPVHYIKSRSRNKHRKMWVGWCVSSWWPWFWFVYSIYYHRHTIHYSCILSDWNKLFLRDIYIPRVGVAMAMCRMIRYCYSSLLDFKCISKSYSSGFSILWYGYRYHVTLCINQLHPITVYRTGLGCALFWCTVMCSFY